MPLSDQHRAKISAGVKLARANPDKYQSPRRHGNETRAKISDAIKAAWAKGRFSAVNFNVPKQSRTKRADSQLGPAMSVRRLLAEAAKAWEDCGKREKRRRVMREQEGRCIECGIYEWNGKPLTLELHHIDGDRRNNSRENIEYRCPNCHSQTPNYRRYS